MRKYLVLFAVVALLSVSAAAAFADITPKTYTRTYSGGSVVVTHPYGFWNNPATQGWEAYNFNNPQDYTTATASSPHGNYSTGTHKCRECHAVHRASGKFKLTRADSRTEACEWCHGCGAGSGFNIQMDNDDALTQEYNVGHTLGFGVNGGKYKAPDDTYPAYTPKYYMGGFSCIDCHSPHGNKWRVIGYNNFWQALGWTTTAQAWAGGYESFDLTLAPSKWLSEYVIRNPGAWYRAGAMTTLGSPAGIRGFKAGTWILVKNPDQEIAWTTMTPSSTLPPVFVKGSAVVYGPHNPIRPGEEIPDILTHRYNGVATSAASTALAVPVNKMAIDWEVPMGSRVAGEGEISYRDTERASPGAPLTFVLAEFCADCHDGNAGLHTVATAMYSEDRAERNDTVPYDIGYSHDAHIRH